MSEFENKKAELKQIIRQFSSNGNYVEAIPYMEEYCDLIKGNLGAESDRYVTVINDLGEMYRNVGDFENSFKTFSKALELIEEKIGRQSIQYATTTVNFACMYRLTEDLEKAETMFLSALETYDRDESFRKIVEKIDVESIDKDEVVLKSTLYANASNNLATLYQDMGKNEESIKYLNISLELLKNTDNYQYIGISLCNLAVGLMQMGDLDKAEDTINESIELFTSHGMNEHPSYLMALNNLASIYFYKGELPKALENFEIVEPLLKKTYGVNSPQYQSLVYNIEEVRAELTDNKSEVDLVDEIISIEWDMFQKVNNRGGRASCQNNYDTFEIMRMAQYKAWSRPLLESYLGDLNNALKSNRNLVMEKYARMMKQTHFLEYQEIKHTLPYISPEKAEFIKVVCELYKEQEEEYSKKYPNMRGKGRPVELGKTATVAVYLEGEISTYTIETLEVYKKYLEELKSQNQNIVIKINDNIAVAYGYKSIEDAEAKLATK